MTRRTRKQSGFTLVEVLIAMFIFALISAGTMTALTSSLRGKAQMNEHLSVIAEIDGARALMKSDFENITLIPMRDAYGGQVQYAMTGGIDNLVQFTRKGRTNPGGLEARSEFQRVSYVFEDGQLIRRALAHANPAPQTPTSDRILMRGLQSVSVSFRVTAKEPVASERAQVTLLKSYSQDQILIEPNQSKDLPERITVEAIFENGDTLTQHFETGL